MQESFETRIRGELLRIESENGAKEVAQRHQKAEAWKQADDAAIEESAAAVQQQVEAQPRPARPPPWRDRLQRDIPHDWRRCDRGSESILWRASSYLEQKATIQEGVKRYHLCLNNFPRLKRRTERVGQRDPTSEFGLDFRYSERAY